MAIFKSHLSSRIIISEENPVAQHFIYIKSLIWLHSCPLLKISTNPYDPSGCCGRTSHSSHRSSRRRLCPAWNKSCFLCTKRGHFQKVCKTAFKEHVDKFEAVKEENYNKPSFGEIAGLAYGMSQIEKQVQSMNKLTVPHMLYDELKWINSQPPAPPYIKLQVTKVFLENNFKPPSAY